jgi:hypothetical protein
MNFKEWMQAQPDMGTQMNKPWKASKEDALKHWNSLAPGLPIAQLRIIPSNHKGTTIAFDGLRITGSATFIDCVISRLKELLAYEGGNTRLNVLYKQQIDNKTQQAIPNSYTFYLHVKQRGKNE